MAKEKEKQSVDTSSDEEEFETELELEQPVVKSLKSQRKKESSIQRDYSKITKKETWQPLRTWRVTPPGFGRTTGLTIIYEGQNGNRIYIGDRPLLKVGNAVISTRAKEGRQTYQFQQTNSNYFYRSVNNQRMKDPDGILKVTFRFAKVNFHTNNTVVYQKTYSVSLSPSGSIQINDLLEEVSISMEKADFLDPIEHLGTPVDEVYQIDSSVAENDADDV